MIKMTLKDEIYRKYRLGTNMTLKELKTFKKNNKVKQGNIHMNTLPKVITLTKLKKNKWDVKNIKAASEIIKLRKKVKSRKSGKRLKKINLSKKTIDLMILGFNPNK